MIGKTPINDLHMVSQWLIGGFGCMVWNQRKFLDFMITMETNDVSAFISWNHERDIAGDVAFPLCLMYCMIAPTIKKVQWMAGAKTLLLTSNLLSPIWSLVLPQLWQSSPVCHRWQSGSAKFRSIFLDLQSSSTLARASRQLEKGLRLLGFLVPALLEGHLAADRFCAPLAAAAGHFPWGKRAALSKRSWI